MFKKTVEIILIKECRFVNLPQNRQKLAIRKRGSDLINQLIENISGEYTAELNNLPECSNKPIKYFHEYIMDTERFAVATMDPKHVFMKTDLSKYSEEDTKVLVECLIRVMKFFEFNKSFEKRFREFYDLELDSVYRIYLAVPSEIMNLSLYSELGDNFINRSLNGTVVYYIEKFIDIQDSIGKMDLSFVVVPDENMEESIDELTERLMNDEEIELPPEHKVITVGEDNPNKMKPFYQTIETKYLQ